MSRHPFSFNHLSIKGLRYDDAYRPAICAGFESLILEETYLFTSLKQLNEDLGRSEVGKRVMKQLDELAARLQASDDEDKATRQSTLDIDM